MPQAMEELLNGLAIQVDRHALVKYPSRELLQAEVDAWQQARNAEQRTIEWNFTRQDADRKLGRHNVSQLTC